VFIGDEKREVSQLVREVYSDAIDEYVKQRSQIFTIGAISERDIPLKEILVAI